MQAGLAHSYALTSDRLAARCARDHARRACAGATSQSHADAVTLAVSEIVTNAVSHGQGERIRLVLRVNRHEVFVAVLDQGARFEASPVIAGPLAEGGRGLAIVAEVATSWGVLPVSQESKLVWCVIDADEQVGSARWVGPGSAFLLGSSDLMDVPRSDAPTPMVGSAATG